MQSSRPGAKAKFEISSYEQAEYQIALTEERIVSYRKTLANTEAMIRHANSLMRTADSGDKKAMKEVIGIARMLESTMKSRGFARPGAKAKMGRPKTVTVITMMSGTGESRGLFKVVGYDENGREFEYGMFAMRSMAEQKAKDVARWTDSKYISSRPGAKVVK